MRGDRERLLDILEAIERIEVYATRGRVTFEQDELIQTFVVHHLQIIGEAVRRITPELRRAHSEIAWARIAAMRHILVHDYFRVDPGEVWATVERDLSPLKRAVATLIRRLEGPR